MSFDSVQSVLDTGDSRVGRQELLGPFHELSREVKLNRRKIGEVPRKTLPGRDFRYTCAGAGQNDLAASEFVPTLSQSFGQP